MHPKTVFITGAATRLGRETALHLAKHGWDVAIHYHSSEEQAKQTAEIIRQAGRRAVALQGNLTESYMPQTLIRKAAQELGTLTALVNNAAIFEKDNLSMLDAGQFDRHMHSNTLAPLLLAQEFAVQLDEHEGAIVNLVDGCEGLSMSPNFLSYTLSKRALEEATLLLAQQLAPRIRVNAVGPGLTLQKPGEEEMFERLLAQVPARKATAPEDIAITVAYLLETPSITGQILRLNGGLGVKG